MTKSSDELLRAVVAQSLTSPIFTPYTLDAGLLVWGWGWCVNILIEHHDDDQLVKLVRKGAYHDFLTKAPIIEVDGQTFARWETKRQITRQL